MKLRQFNEYTLTTFETNDVSLKVTHQKLFKRKKEEYLLKDILISDIYALKHHHKSAIGAVVFFGGLFVHAIFEPILNPASNWHTAEFFGAFTFIFIVRFFVPSIRIFIPTKDQGLIRLYMNQPSKKKVKEFMLDLQAKVQLINKISLIKNKYPYEA